MGKEKKSKKEKKDRKEKSEKRDKKKRRDDSSSSSSDSEDDRRKKRKSEALAQKIAKHLEKKAPVAGYTDDNNPFGDANVSKRFVWTKKIEKDLEEGKSIKDFSSKADRERQLERLQEIEKVKKRREEREADKVRMEEELSMIQRERAVAEALELEGKEEEFHLQQAVVRSERRLREARAKPIDLIVKNLHLTAEFEHDMREPWTFFEGVQLDEVKQLHDDIMEFQELDRYQPEHLEFWNALAELAANEYAEAVKRDEIDRAHLRGAALPSHLVAQDRGLHPSLEKDIEVMLTGRSFAELEKMGTEMEGLLARGEGDPEYWDAVLRRLKLYRAKAKIRELQATFLARHLAQLEAGLDVPKAMGWGTMDQKAAGEAGASGSAEPTEEGEDAAAAEEGEEEEEEDEPVGDGSMSPAPLDPEEVAGKDVVHEEDDYRLLELLRHQVRLAEASKFQLAAQIVARARGNTSAADVAYERLVGDHSRRGRGGVHPMLRNIAADTTLNADELTFRSGREPAFEEDEGTRQMVAASRRIMEREDEDDGDAQTFGDEVQLEAQVYWWHDKYRPRKPKYFNRVHTGYEWNKYNQTHYDHDNPPPKVVQGYKFNIFYPDLIDKSKAPVYRTEKDPASKDGSTCTIVFTAGPPYEDIAFRIVNKEWEHSHKKGFKCTFERGILHLYFNFKRARYRR